MNTSRLEQLKALLAEDPTDAFLQYGIAMEYAKLGQRNVAIEQVKELLSTQPDYLGAYYQLGKWLEEEQQTEEAILVYKKGMEIAKQQQKRKAENELREALQQVEDW